MFDFLNMGSSLIDKIGSGKRDTEDVVQAGGNSGLVPVLALIAVVVAVYFFTHKSK